MSARYHYVVINQSVAAVIHSFGANLGLRVSVAPDVKGVIHGVVAAGDAKTFLDEITHEDALDWYDDGFVLYVSPAADEQTVVTRLRDISFKILYERLQHANLLDSRYVFQPQGRGDVVIAGPPAYVAVVKQAVDSGAFESASPETPARLVVYRGSETSNMSLP